MSQESISKLRSWMTEQAIDAFLVTQPQNRIYLSGWFDEHDDAGMLLIGQQQQLLLTNHLYAEIATREAAGWDIVVPPGREHNQTIIARAREQGWRTLGFEASALSYAAFAQLSEAGQGTVTLKPIHQDPIDVLRLVKQPAELALLKQAIAITDATFAHLCEWIEPGMTEKAVAWEIFRTMIELGADGTSFDSIVASGPNGSMPHAVPSQRQIQRGELITIDMGARYQGYCADMTRTICLGEPAEPRMREVYDTVLRAMRTCEQHLHAGLTGREADALTRNVLQVAGLGEYYVHSTGHGIGLQIHEGPSLSQRSPEDLLLPEGCVVTVEPGVYIPDWTGLRIEDSVLVKADGVEVLSQSPTELVISC